LFHRYIIDLVFNKYRWFVGIGMFFCLSISSQKVYCQQGTFIANGPNGLYSVDISTCNKTLLTTYCNYPSGSIALDGTTLYINDGANLYSTTLGPTGTTNNCDLLGAFLSRNKSIYGLTVGPDGIVYAASDSLIETYNPVTKTFGTLGHLPSNFLVGGDLLFYKGDLYEMCSNNNLVLVNRANPSASKVYMQFTAGTIFGLASVTKKCSPNQLYAISRSGDIYAVDMVKKVQTITPTCRLGIFINDAASIAETQSTPPPNPPTAPSPIVYCVNTSAVPLTATPSGSNDTLKWYADASSRDVITAPTPIVGSVQTTTTYYVTQVDTISGCESDRTKVIVNVDTLSSPSIKVVASATTVCTGAPVKFTATTEKGGTPPQFQWQLNGIDVGLDTSVFLNDNLKDGSLIKCKLVSNAKCLRTPNAISNTVAITVNKIDSLPTIKITASDTSFSPCSIITFKSSITEGGTKPKFIWKQNGVVVGTNDAVFTSGNFVDKDTITCSLISNWAVCLLADTIVSNRIMMYATGYATPTDSIYSDTTIVCSGNQVIFISKATDGGTAPRYTWKINGRILVNNGSDSFFKTTALKDGDVVSCTLNSNIPCPLNNLAESNAIKMHVLYTPDSVITIQTSDTNICPGAKASFMATSPRNLQLDWAMNGVYIETNSTNSFSTAILQDGDKVSCRFVTDYGCGIVTISSNPIVVRVVKDVPPTIVVKTDTTTICSGSTVAFSITTTNGGVKPHYQWMVNGNKVGGDSAKFSTSILSDGDAVSCSILSDIVCLTKKDGASAPLKIKVISPALVPPIVGSTSVCQGKSISLTNKTIGGKWTSSAKDIITIDSIWGIVTGYKSGTSTISYAIKNSCGTTTQTLVLTVVDSPNVFTIKGPDSVCVNNTVQLIEQAKGGEWSSDNAAIATVDKASGIVSGMNAGTDSIKYTISNSCGTDYKAKVIYVVGEKATGSYTKQEPTCIAPASGSVTVNISGMDKSFQYEINGNRYTNGSAASGLFAGNYEVLLYNSLGCMVDSFPVELKLKIDATCDTFYVPTVFMPFGSYTAGRQLRPYGGSSSIKQLSFRVLNRYGNLVYESHDLNKGWDGTINGVLQETGAYVWYLNYTLFNGAPKEMKGTSVLIR